MDKTYNHQGTEQKIYAMWEKGGYFTPRIDRTKTPFSILLPLPNANDPMHMGHAMFTVQDILVRYHRMKGDPTLWLPGGDHAGIETQYVFEKKLAKEGKSRFMFDRETLYRMIAEYVEANKNINRDQMKRLGFSLDWTRYHYSLEPAIVAIVLDTFIKMHGDGLVYRDQRLVNYCTKCGTAYSDLEVKHVERTDPLYYMKYGPFIIATVRPETKFGDTAVAFHPKDKRYLNWEGKEIRVEGLAGPFTVKVIADEAIDPEFGTGIAKVTPAHDFKDFEIAKRHTLPAKQVIAMNGRLTEIAGPYAGMKVKEARQKVAADLRGRGLIDHVDEKYVHTVATCYKCGSDLEPLPIPQWYVKTKPLAEKAIQAVRDGKTRIVPLKRFENMYFEWLHNILDWNISRQIVWGPRIPVWYNIDENPKMEVVFIDKGGNRIIGNIHTILEKNAGQDYSFEEIEKGLQQLIVPEPSKYVLSDRKPGDRYLQDTDTFDTWFLSSQWPLTTLGFPDSEDFTYFYPTSVLDTMWDILFFWVARMMMMGLYRAGDVPFKVVHLHSRVVDAHGQKMSKSKGNVMNPIDMVDKYGADALRMALMYGAAPGSDIAISEDKIRGMRNFSNKLWNMGRFILMTMESDAYKGKSVPDYNPAVNKQLAPGEQKIVSETESLVTEVTGNIERYRFSDAAQRLYEFAWHRLADVYLEESKGKLASGDETVLGVLRYVYRTVLTLLHPFMPFVTEEIWSQLSLGTGKPLIITPWPEAKPPRATRKKTSSGSR